MTQYREITVTEENSGDSFTFREPIGRDEFNVAAVYRSLDLDLGNMSSDEWFIVQFYAHACVQLVSQGENNKLKLPAPNATGGVHRETFNAIMDTGKFVEQVKEIRNGITLLTMAVEDDLAPPQDLPEKKD